MRRVAEKAVQQACGSIRKRYEGDSNQEQLAYHDVRHTVGVIRRTVAILHAIGVNDKTMMNGIVVASFHDTVQHMALNETTEEFDGKEFTRTTRGRPEIGRSEKDSAKEAIAFMDAVNLATRKTLGQEFFTEEDKDMASEAMIATIPDFSPKTEGDPKSGTVYQSKLTPESLVETRALALADIGAPGMEKPELFVTEGDRVFREAEVSIADALHHPEHLDDEYREYFRSKMLQWIENQITFAQGRKARLEDELKGLSEEVKKGEKSEKELVRELFPNFDESIMHAKNILKKRRDMSFEDIAKDMGYRFAA